MQLARLAWRESRSTRRKLFLYMSTIAVGVAALVSIDSFARNVTRSVREQSRAVLGGDILLTSRRPFAKETEQYLDSLDSVGVRNVRLTTFPSMAVVPRNGNTRLSQIYGVGVGYPLYGEITTDPPGRYNTLQSGANALVDPSLLITLDAHVGDTLKIGYGKFVIAGTLKDVPGASGLSSAFAPRVYIPDRYLPETRLLVFGSTADYSVLLKLDAGADPDAFIKPFRARLRKQDVQIRTVTQAEERAARATESLANFIGIVGMVALLLGGIGVASGVRAFVARKIDTVAIFRCLGASGNQVLGMYVAQAAVMGLLGAVIGAAAGVVVQFLLPLAFAGMLPVDVHVSVEPVAIATGILIGGWIALVFALRPLLALRNVSPLQALRRDADADVLRMSWRDAPRMIVNVALVLSVVGVAVARAQSVKQGVWLAAATGVVLLVLALVASALAWVAKRSVRAGWPYVIRQGLANVYRPANQTRAVMLSLGFGAFLVTTLYLVQNSIVSDLSVNAASSGANLLLFDVQDKQAAPIDSLIQARGFKVTQQSPVVPMRIASINGHSAESISADTMKNRRAGWAVRREYRSTFRDSISAGETLTAGKWFAPDSGTRNSFAAGDTGEVSLDAGVAGELKVKLGDEITWNVQGVNIPTRVTSLRDVKWTRFEPNFFAVFPSWVLRDAPHQYTVLANVPGPQSVAIIQRDVVRDFPNVSSIDLSLLTATIGKIVDRASTAVRFMALFSVIMGIPVLFSAVSSTRRERVRESVLLKTLGATRAQIMSILVVEYALLGVLGSLTGLVLALGGGWALVHFVFQVKYSPDYGPAIAITAAMMAIAIAIGVIAGRGVFKETAMTSLREN
ncbi:MAG: FtsX-like permease family protein [Gemmatimonadaceae bacterium]